MDSVRHRIIRGLSWSSFAHLLDQCLTLIVGIILARLLSPQEYGLIAMVMVFTGFATMLIPLGLSDAIVQKEDLEEKHLSSIFWVNLAAGAILTMAGVAASPLIAGFYDEPLLSPLMMVLSLTFLIRSLNVVQGGLLVKNLDYRRLAMISGVSTFVSGTIAIIMAITGFGVWSLAIQSLIGAVIRVFLMWTTSNWRPHFLFDLSALMEVLGFSANLVGHNFACYWAGNLDRLLIGRSLGSSALGAYGRAYQLMLLPVQQVQEMLSRVMFPVFSSIQQDKDRIKQIYLRAVSHIALFTFPLMLGLMVVSRAFVLTVLGPQWEGVVPVLQVFCILGMSHSVGTTVSWIYMSQGRTDWMFRWAIYAFVVKSLGIIIGLRWGIVGVATGYTVASLLFLEYPQYAVPGRLIGMTFGEVVRSVADVFGCAAGMAVLVWVAGLLLPADWPHWAYLLVKVPFGMMVYGVLIHLFGLRAYREMGELIREQFRPGWRTATVTVNA